MVQLSRHSPGSVKRSIGVNVIDAMLQRDLLGIRPDGPVIEARAVEASQRGLRRQRQGIRSPIQQGDPFIAGQG